MFLPPGIPCNLVSNLNRNVTPEDLAHFFDKEFVPSLERIRISRPLFVVLEDVATLLDPCRVSLFHDMCESLQSHSVGYRRAVGLLDSYDLGAQMSRNRIFWVLVRDADH